MALEPEVSRLNNSCMYRADGHFVNLRAIQVEKAAYPNFRLGIARGVGINPFLESQWF